ncbi:FG-GAP repeat protein [Streptomyces sp. R39]|uniref:FG-GAP repeat protein n=1 Tax=Streptomyces sp. R39 TaxID=3238631 RepID=A0AB39QS99_9ACTN
MAVADPEATVSGDAKAGLVRVVYGGGKGTSELNQDLAPVPGDAGPNDYFGDSLATVDYNKDGCTDLVVGTSREDVGSATDAGTVDVIYRASGGLGTGKAALHLEQGMGSEGILAASSESGDRMGTQVALVNRDPGATATDESLVMAVGVPGEDIGTVADAGAVQVFGLRGTPGAADRWVEAGNTARGPTGRHRAAGHHLRTGHRWPPGRRAPVRHVRSVSDGSTAA